MVQSAGRICRQIMAERNQHSRSAGAAAEDQAQKMPLPRKEAAFLFDRDT
jgi:hypothetical protein